MTPIVMITIDSIQPNGTFSALRQTIDDTGIHNERCLFRPGETAEAEEFGLSEAQMNLIVAMWTPDVIQDYQNSLTA